MGSFFYHPPYEELLIRRNLGLCLLGLIVATDAAVKTREAAAHVGCSCCAKHAPSEEGERGRAADQMSAITKEGGDGGEGE